MEFGHPQEDPSASNRGNDGTGDEGCTDGNGYVQGGPTFGPHFVSEAFDAQQSDGFYGTSDDDRSTPPTPAPAAKDSADSTLVAHVNLRFGVRSAADIAEYCGVEGGRREAEGLKAKVLQRLNSKAKQAVARVHASSMAEYIVTLNTMLSVYRLPAVVEDHKTSKLGPACEEKDLVFQRPLSALVDARLHDLGRRDTVTFRYVSSAPDYVGRCTESTDDGYGSPNLSRAQTLDDASVPFTTAPSSVDADRSSRGDATTATGIGSSADLTTKADGSAAGRAEGSDACRLATSQSKMSSSNFQLYRRLRLYEPPQARFGSIGLTLHFQPLVDDGRTTLLPFQKHNFMDVRFQTSAIRDVWWAVFHATIGAQLLQSVREGPEHESQRQPSSSALDRMPSTTTGNSSNNSSSGKQLVDLTRRPSVDKFVAYFRSDVTDHAEVDAGGEVRVVDPMIPPDGGILNVVFNPLMTKPRRVWLEDLRTRGPDGVTVAPDAGPDSVEPHLVIGPCNMRQRLRMVPSHAFPLRTLTVSAEDDQWGNAFYLERHDAVSVVRSMSHLARRMVQVDSTPPDGGTPTDKSTDTPPGISDAAARSFVGKAAPGPAAMAPAFLRVQLLTKSFVVRLKWMQWFVRVLGKPIRYVHDSTKDDQHHGTADPWESAAMLAAETGGNADSGVPPQRTHGASVVRHFSWSCAQPLTQPPQRSGGAVAASPRSEATALSSPTAGEPRMQARCAADARREGDASGQSVDEAQREETGENATHAAVESTAPSTTPTARAANAPTDAEGNNSRLPPSTLQRTASIGPARDGGTENDLQPRTTDDGASSGASPCQQQPGSRSPMPNRDGSAVASSLHNPDLHQRSPELGASAARAAMAAVPRTTGIVEAATARGALNPTSQRPRTTSVAASVVPRGGGAARQRASTLTTRSLQAVDVPQGGAAASASPLPRGMVTAAVPDASQATPPTQPTAPPPVAFVADESPLLVAYAPYVLLRKPGTPGHCRGYDVDDAIVHWVPCRLCILQYPSAPPHAAAMFKDGAVAEAFRRYGCIVGVDVCLCVDWLVRVRMITKPMVSVIGGAYESTTMPRRTSDTEDWAWVQAALEDPDALCLRETCVLELFTEPSSASTALALDHIMSAVSDGATCDANVAQDAVCAACAFQCPLEVHVVGDVPSMWRSRFGGVAACHGPEVDLSDAGPAMDIVDSLLPFLP